MRRALACAVVTWTPGCRLRYRVGVNRHRRHNLLPGPVVQQCGASGRAAYFRPVFGTVAGARRERDESKPVSEAGPLRPTCLNAIANRLRPSLIKEANRWTLNVTPAPTTDKARGFRGTISVQVVADAVIDPCQSAKRFQSLWRHWRPAGSECRIASKSGRKEGHHGRI
jgi:hypothetical protein